MTMIIIIYYTNTFTLVQHQLTTRITSPKPDKPIRLEFLIIPGKKETKSENLVKMSEKETLRNEKDDFDQIHFT